jgi:hypothetical protein
MIDPQPQPLAVFRIYVANHPASRRRTLFQRLFKAPLAVELARSALDSGVMLATVVHHHAGFLPSATRVSFSAHEVAAVGVPVSLELVGDEAVVRAFLDKHRDDLRGAYIFELHGVRITFGSRL